ncbi:cell division protein FtsQ/DivIB [Marixanthomonas spongiae]|uniref:Cell division protein FtsQ n=1 Tax=Marixanthomonas spongiae TaxID=2174845 RepID=A0A2U0I7M5_9FLAO|nr:cell division protein FtsQ/DivIB [Marixanthomonas spongiae]PVW17074.1 hypothetical protein DDV96_00685 [Marixanthomonas spongiae]
MKRSWEYIKFVLLFGLLVFLFSFTNQRNQSRNLTKTKVEFLEENSPFITRHTVNKLLIQNHDSVTSMPKEKVVLKEVESRLLKNEMIRNAEVFINLQGTLGAKITQRNPLGRVAASPDYYIDDEGKKMPLSSVYAARVPLITGTTQSFFTELTPLLIAIDQDPFMKSSVVGLEQQQNGEIVLRLRKHDFKVLFGKPKAIANKFQNFKAFYKKTKQDNKLSSYKLVNLQFGNQVVATKIQSDGK